MVDGKYINPYLRNNFVNNSVIPFNEFPYFRFFQFWYYSANFTV